MNKNLINEAMKSVAPFCRDKRKWKLGGKR
jgi:hypothetical protein